MVSPADLEIRVGHNIAAVAQVAAHGMDIFADATIYEQPEVIDSHGVGVARQLFIDLVGGDVAILVLDRAIEGVAPVQLATRRPAPGTNVMLVSWGSLQDSPLQFPSQRQQRRVTLVKGGLAQEDFFDASQEVLYAPAYSAPGDSGGSMMVRERGVWKLLGITSRGLLASQLKQDLPNPSGSSARYDAVVYADALASRHLVDDAQAYLRTQ